MQSEKAPWSYYEWFPKAEFCLSIEAVTVFRWAEAVAYPGILFGVGGSTNSVRTEDRERGSGGGSVLEAAVIWYKKIHFI